MNQKSINKFFKSLLFNTFTLAMLLCFAIPSHADKTTDFVMVDMTVPSNLNVILNADGTNTISEFKVQNNTILPVYLDTIHATSLDEWELVESDINFLTDQKQISLSVGDNTLSAGQNIISNISFDSSEYHRTVTSPNYPNDYPDDMTEAENYWEETFEGASGIQITFSKDCELQSVYFDWIQIYDDTGTSISGKLAGKAFAGKTYMVQGDYVKIAMRSDAHWGYTGFSADLTPIYNSNGFNATVTPSENLLNWSVNSGLFTKTIPNHKAFDILLDFSLGQKEFYITFDGNKSDNTVSAIKAKNGEVVELPSVTKSGSLFIGWKDPNGVIHKDSFVMPAGGSILTAQWAHSPILTTGEKFNATIPAEATEVVFTDEIAPKDAILTDVSAHQTESVMAWLDGTTYKVSSQLPDIKVIANADSSYLFNGCTGLNKIDVNMLDVSSTTNMRNMFAQAGYNAASFELDLSSWDTSSVTNMRNMFEKTGYKSSSLTINLSGWNTSKVTTMTYMFAQSGYSADEWNIIGLSEFNTSSVTNFSYMFYRAGYNADNVDLQLSKWNTSSATTLSRIFEEAGYKAGTFNVSAKNWDLSGITSTGWIFTYAFVNASNVQLDLSGWDISNVTSMQYMFSNVGRNANTFYINATDWKTSNVTSMKAVFYETFSSASEYKIDGLATWDTSKVTTMENMFYKAGVREVDFSTWDTSNVTNMNGILASCKYLSKMVLGENFAFVGLGNGYSILPTPSSAYIPGATGKWYNEETGVEYAKNSIPGNVAATYVAVPPVLQTEIVVEDPISDIPIYEEPFVETNIKENNSENKSEQNIVSDLETEVIKDNSNTSITHDETFSEK